MYICGMSKDYKSEGMAVYDKHVAFWGGVFSNFYPCNIHYGGNKALHYPECDFKSSEQYFMWQKAIFFNDSITAREILNAETPKEAKKLGRQVVGFDEKEWEDVREDIMYVAVYQKFKQNESLRDFLLSDEFKGKGFVEGSPIDGIWGVKVHYESPNIDDESNWNGLNLLGKTLDKVRRELLQNE